MRDRWLVAAIGVLLTAAGLAAWSLSLRTPPRSFATRLEGLPMQLGSWTGETLPIGQTVESILDATYNLQRGYTRPGDPIVWLYLGYYDTARGGTPEHTPRACYHAFGWRVAESATLLRDPERGLRATEYRIELGDEQRLVLFWYQTFRSRDLVSTLELHLDHMLGQLLHRRADGALVRLSTPIIGGDRAGARARLLDLARLLDPALVALWPEERPVAPTPEAP